MKHPWGGGNKFAIDLSNYLKAKGWKVNSDLKDKDIDIILMTEPRKYSQTSNYNQLRISRYLIVNPNTIVVHRINNCDEGRNTKNLNKYLARANKVADCTIFISNYLKEIYIDKGLIKNNIFFVIKNGANSKLFNMDNRKRWNKKDKLRVVTHHWSNNYNKGFDIYKKLDEIVLSGINGVSIDFYYIGNVPENFHFKNSLTSFPIESRNLADEIKRNHIYITGAKGEGAGMHHIEGAMCGLPLLYRNSGALPEYCSGFGVMFEGVDDFENKLGELIEKYDFYFDKMKEYPYNSELMCRGYEDVFLTLLQKKNQLNIARRRLRFLSIFVKELFLQSIEVVLWKLKNLIRRIKSFR